MTDYTKEFLEFENISKIYAECFLNNHFGITQSSDIPDSVRCEMERLYVMYEYLLYKNNFGLKIKDEELVTFLKAVGKSNYIKTLNNFCTHCGRFTRECYDESSLVRYMMDYNKKLFNYELDKVSYPCSDDCLILEGKYNV